MLVLVGMETIVGYAFDRGSGAANAGVERVEAYYRALWGADVVRDRGEVGAVGLISWSRTKPLSSWPAWRTSGELCVASLYAPLGYESIAGDLAPEQAAVPLARGVLAAPGRMLELAAPFVLGVVDRAAERLDLFTDSVGLGRLFQVRMADGWVWSNRPVAACLFADLPLRASTEGWQYAAGCGWFMGDTTPYAGVLVVPGATHIAADGRRRIVTRIDPASVWSGTTPVEETAEGLRTVVRSIGRLWPGTPTVDLSGGRDSRVVAAAFLSAGVDVQLNSYGPEVSVAEQLVAALPYEVEHVVKRPQPVLPASSASPALPEVVDRARRWHRYGEGLRPASYLFHGPPADLAGVDHLAIGGAGGEVAHGHFYPRDVLKLDPNIDVFTQQLTARLVPARGPAEAAREAVRTQVQRVLREASAGGLDDARMLDHFYIVERLRRWGTTAERSGVVSPLLLPAFMRGALGLTTRQRLGNELHLALLRELVPQWADIPFYKPAASVPAQVKRLGAVPDQEEVRVRLRGSDDFDDAEIRTLWAMSAAGKSTAADEVALRQLLWRSVFDDHLGEVNQHITRPPAATSAPARPASAPVQAASVQAGAAPVRMSPLKRRVRRNPAVRRLAGTPLWRSIRKYLR
jgi:hypothetical protein